MRLSTLIKENRVIANLPGPTLADGVEALLQLLKDDLGETKLAEVREALGERRAETVDAMGQGISVPHLRVEGLDNFYICVGNSPKGLLAPEPGQTAVDDGPRVHLVFLMLAPQTQITLMLQALASIARLCHNQDTRHALQNCKQPGRVARLIEESDVEIKRSVTASDAARECLATLSPDDNLAATLKILVRSDESALPVIDDKERVIGVVYPSRLFKLGMPKYVDILSDVDLLNNFEPFEQLFVNEKTMKVSEILEPEAPTVSADAPILQVAHMMISRPTTTVFVVDADGRCQGVIHESDILAKVLTP